MNIQEILEQFELLEDYTLVRNITGMTSQDKVLNGYNHYYNPDKNHSGAGYYDGHRITSGIGIRNLGSGKHYGLDLAFSLNEPVKSFCNGRVIMARFEAGGYGNFVYIEDKAKYWHVYGHLNQRNVKDGQMVKAGDVIGLAGNTGESYDVHLHYSIWKPIKGSFESDRAIDPRLYQYP